MALLQAPLEASIALGALLCPPCTLQLPPDLSVILRKLTLPLHSLLCLLLSGDARRAPPSELNDDPLERPPLLCRRDAALLWADAGADHVERLLHDRRREDVLVLQDLEGRRSWRSRST